MCHMHVVHGESSFETNFIIHGLVFHSANMSLHVTLLCTSVYICIIAVNAWHAYLHACTVGHGLLKLYLGYLSCTLVMLRTPHKE